MTAILAAAREAAAAAAAAMDDEEEEVEEEARGVEQVADGSGGGKGGDGDDETIDRADVPVTVDIDEPGAASELTAVEGQLLPLIETPVPVDNELIAS